MNDDREWVGFRTKCNAWQDVKGDRLFVTWGGTVVVGFANMTPERTFVFEIVSSEHMLTLNIRENNQLFLSIPFRGISVTKDQFDSCRKADDLLKLVILNEIGECVSELDKKMTDRAGVGKVTHTHESNPRFNCEPRFASVLRNLIT